MDTVVIKLDYVMDKMERWLKNSDNIACTQIRSHNENSWRVILSENLVVVGIQEQEMGAFKHVSALFPKYAVNIFDISCGTAISIEHYGVIGVVDDVLCRIYEPTEHIALVLDTGTYVGIYMSEY